MSDEVGTRSGVEKGAAGDVPEVPVERASRLSSVHEPGRNLPGCAAIG